jgi:hypothetical protein
LDELALNDPRNLLPPATLLSIKYGIPREAVPGARESVYPEYQETITQFRANAPPR